MDRLVLYSYYRSSAAYRVRIALNLKAIDHSIVPVNLAPTEAENWQQSYLEINPQGFVPALKTAGQIITQSLAIIEYLDEKYPDPRLVPGDIEQRAFCRSIAQIICCDIHPLNNLRVLDYLRDNMEQSGEHISQWYSHWLTEGLLVIEQRLQESHYHMTESPGLIEICLIPQIYNAIRFNCNLEKMQAIRQIYNACMKLDAFSAASPEQQIDYIQETSH